VPKQTVDEVQPPLDLLPSPAADADILWDLLIMAFFASAVVFRFILPLNPFFGIVLMGLAALAAGYALGRD